MVVQGTLLSKANNAQICMEVTEVCTGIVGVFFQEYFPIYTFLLCMIQSHS